MELSKILFICSRNQWRSPTAENIWRRSPHLQVRSAGTSPKAKRRVSSSDLLWSDVIFVMEERHKKILKARFEHLLDHKTIYILDIPDEYKYMDPELVDILKESVSQYLTKDDPLISP